MSFFSNETTFNDLGCPRGLAIPIGIFTLLQVLYNLTLQPIVVHFYGGQSREQWNKNVFLVMIAICSIATTVLVDIMLIINAFIRKSIFGIPGCKVQGFFQLLSTLLILQSHLALTVDHYLLLKNQVKYKLIDLKDKIRYFGIGAAVVSVIALAPAFGWSHFVNEGYNLTCSFDYTSTNAATRSHLFIVVVLAFFVPSVIIVKIHYQFHQESKLSRKESTFSTIPFTNRVVTSTPSDADKSDVRKKRVSETYINQKHQFRPLVNEKSTSSSEVVPSPPVSRKQSLPAFFGSNPPVDRNSRKVSAIFSPTFDEPNLGPILEEGDASENRNSGQTLTSRVQGRMAGNSDSKAVKTVFERANSAEVRIRSLRSSVWKNIGSSEQDGEPLRKTSASSANNYQNYGRTTDEETDTDNSESGSKLSLIRKKSVAYNVRRMSMEVSSSAEKSLTTLIDTAIAKAKPMVPPTVKIVKKQEDYSNKTKTLATLFCVFIICWIPYLLIFLLHQCFPYIGFLHPAATTTFVMLGKLANISVPVVLIWKDLDFREKCMDLLAPAKKPQLATYRST